MRSAKTADQEKIARLESIVAMLRRAQYGTRSEKLRIDPLDAEQLAFVFDELQTVWARSGPNATIALELLSPVRRGRERALRRTWNASSRSSSQRVRPTVLVWRPSASARTSPSALL